MRIAFQPHNGNDGRFLAIIVHPDSDTSTVIALAFVVSLAIILGYFFFRRGK